ncbi:group I truncated hemoglobin [Nocardioides acrostichi]|uniref:Group 1 truncated hemoglobin n=1 Tax=Nocardioides acrostichi TaxID=2784339 RepID=A0A930USM7_9ACTN|nr:group 1 truncated hemoglobin [Nocardioides acrostichi]MBF4160113.1 group 1 truncated hemoglobin [Nocardioides acrostichi]
MDPTLYDALGGREAIGAAVDGLYGRLLTDPETGPVFEGIDMPRLRNHMISFLAAALGSDLVYAGRDMGDAHAGLHITDRMFDRTAAHLEAVLAQLSVPEALVERVLITIAPLRAAIVHGNALV